MIDKEKVIKGLEIQLDDLQKYADPDEMLTLTQEQAKEIVALLKKQETVEPPPERTIPHWIFGNTMGHSWMKCSECCVSQSGQMGCWTYCPNCGAEMKGDTEVEID